VGIPFDNQISNRHNAHGLAALHDRQTTDGLVSHQADSLFHLVRRRYRGQRLAANIHNLGSGEVSSLRQSTIHDIAVGEDAADLTIMLRVLMMAYYMPRHGFVRIRCPSSASMQRASFGNTQKTRLSKGSDPTVRRQMIVAAHSPTHGNRP
jgi:hypothetical protein